MHVWTMVSTYRYLYIQTRQCTRYTNASCCVSNSHFLEFRIRWDSIQWYLSPLNSRRVTFSLLLSSLNISSISCLQSSCMVWKLAFLRGCHKGWGGYFIQPTKDFCESRPLMRLLMPAIWKSHHSQKMLSCIFIVFPKVAWSNTDVKSTQLSIKTFCQQYF